jgi:acyl-CoA thioester hydrolase
MIGKSGRFAVGELPKGAAPHVFPVRIYWEDTDASGIVYHANYLKFAERARSEWLRDLGKRQSEMLDESGIGFVVRRATMDFVRPAKLDDLVEIETVPRAATGATLTLDQTVYQLKDAKSLSIQDSDLAFQHELRPILVTVSVQLACVDRRGRAVRLPQSIRDAMAGLYRPR